MDIIEVKDLRINVNNDYYLGKVKAPSYELGALYAHVTN